MQLSSQLRKSFSGGELAMKRTIVEAGAGCGKTYSLVSFYISCLGYDPETGKRLRQDVLSPREIFCLTFTELAAKEMLERVLKRLTELGLKEVFEDVLAHAQISTFHSFCYRLLAKELPAMGYKTTQIENEAWVRYRREMWIREKLFAFPERQKLLAIASLGQVVDWSLENWFRTEAFDLNTVKSRLGDQLASLARKREEMREGLRSFLASYPENRIKKAQSWPVLLLDYLDNSSKDLLADIKFNRPSQPSVSKVHPELARLCQAFVKLEKEEVLKSFEGTHVAQEEEFLQLLEEFFSFFRAGSPRYLDFAALELEILQILRDPESKFWADWKAPQHFIVDEFQDTNHAQLEILERLSSPETSWYLVGDPKQSIYSFRAAKIEIFRKLTQELELKQLSTNYRSETGVLSFLNDLGDKLFSDPHDDPPPQRLSGAKNEASEHPPVRYWVRGDNEKRTIHWQEQLAAFALRQHEEPGDSHAFLFLRWKKLYAFAQYMEECAQPYSILGKEAFLDHHLTELFCFFLEAIERPDYRLARESLSAWDFDLALIPREELRFSENFLVFVRAISPSRWLKGVEWTSAMEKLVADFEEERMALSLSLGEIAHFIRQISASHTVEASLNAHGQAPKDIPLLLTVHASKGLEFDHIYLAELYERSFSQDFSGGHEAGVDIKFFNLEKSSETGSLLFLRNKRTQMRVRESEMKRVFYVALTRAKKSLDVFYEAGKVRAHTEDLDPFAELFGWPAKLRAGWAYYLDILKEHSSVELRELPTPATAAEAASLWILPEARRREQETQKFFWGGVSEFLKRDKDRKEEDAKTAAVDLLVASKSASSDFGNALHACLEIWDGQMESIPALSSAHPEHAEGIAEAIRALTQIPELSDFFLALGQDSGRIYREFALMVHIHGSCLSGVSDAVFLKDDKEVWILDWKSSSRLEVLQKEDRLAQIEQQLRIYAHALKGLAPRVRIMAIGIYKGRGARREASIVLDKYLSSDGVPRLREAETTI
jgi:ATP-dependent exoDNAse (exonuclease V) beta subunit